VLWDKKIRDERRRRSDIVRKIRKNERKKEGRDEREGLIRVRLNNHCCCYTSDSRVFKHPWSISIIFLRPGWHVARRNYDIVAGAFHFFFI
jgi:hypothetical protein